MEIFKYENSAFMVNTYLVVNKRSKEAFILDPGSSIESLVNKIDEDQIKPVAIIATHGHIDHIAGAKYFKEKYSIPFYINELDKDYVETIAIQAQMLGAPPAEPVSIDQDLPSKGPIEIAGLELELLHTPGHSPGSVSIKIKNVVFTGDSLFNFSIGRTDFPGCSHDQLIASIKEKLLTLPDETNAFPGHGPSTTIGKEKEWNPFFK